MDKISWEAWTRRLAGDDPASTQQFWAYARDLIHSFLRKEHPHLPEADLDDLAQEATEKAARFCLRPKHNVTSVSEDKFQGFLEGVAQTTFWDFSERGRRYQRALARSRENQTRSQPEAPDEAAQRQELLETLRDLVSQLTKREADVIHLYWAGRTHKEIAERLRLTPASVGNLLHRARKRLRKLLPRDEELLIPAGSGLSQEPEEVRLTPELREWAMRQFTEEEVVAGLRELREKGGLELKDFLPELERIVEQGSEPTQ